MSKTKKITTCAILIAIAFVLNMVSKILPAPWLQGGSVTLASAVPIIIASIIFGTQYGIISAIIFAVLQMMTGFYPPPTQTVFNYFLVVFIDYILAFGVYGLAGLFYNRKYQFTIPVSGFVVMLLRYVCHFISGVLIWGVYAEEGQTVIAYSILYNGSYMIPEIIITTIVLALCIKLIKRMED